jgi:hypothetical protein
LFVNEEKEPLTGKGRSLRWKFKFLMNFNVEFMVLKVLSLSFNFIQFFYPLNFQATYSPSKTNDGDSFATNSVQLSLPASLRPCFRSLSIKATL